MLKQLLKYKWYIFCLFLFIIIEPSLNSIMNFWLQKLFNTAAPGADKILILRMLTTGFLLWILKRVAGFTSSVVKARFICNAKRDIKHKMFVNIFHLDTANISSIAASGEYISFFTNDITIIETRFYNQIMGLISSIFSIAILGAAFLALNRKLALAILAFGLISTFVPVIFSRQLNENSMIYSLTISRFTQKLKEYISAYPTIKNYSIESAIIRHFTDLNQQTEDSKYDSDYALSLANNVGQLLAWFMQFIGVGFGLILVIKGEIRIGTVIAAQSFAADLAMPLQNLIINVNSIKSVKEIVKKIEDLSSDAIAQDLGAAPGAPADEALVPAGGSDCDLCFNKLSLTLNSKPIIEDFTYRFEHGKKYLIIGINGAGKSSIFKTLKKWYPITSGDITLGGCDIRSLSSDEISRRVSYLNENVSLFSGTVKENITLYRNISEDSFDRARTDAQVSIDLDRNVAEEGRNVSSGEQRRIEIARSLLNSVEILIFDEVISTLDIETAYEIEKLALDFQDKTIIFISHNFSGKLIREYDDILVLDGGKLIDHGPYDSLIRSCEYFRKICDIKFGDLSL